MFQPVFPVAGESCARPAFRKALRLLIEWGSQFGFVPNKRLCDRESRQLIEE